MTDALFELIAVHCFFDCGHVVRELDPQIAHDVMEQHYSAQHREDIRRVLTEPLPSPHWRRA